MTRETIFDWEAEVEAEEARQWCAERNPAAARRFVASLRAAVRLIQEAPERWPEFQPGVRRVLLKKLPYAVVYVVKPERVLVLAVVPFSRHPEYWRGRPRKTPGTR